MMTQFANDDVYPGNAVVYVEAWWGQLLFTGSGFIAGPNDVITAAHCIYNASLGGWADRVRVTVSYDPSEPTGWNRQFWASNFRGYTDFDPDRDGRLISGDFNRGSIAGSEKDIALISFREVISQGVGWFGMTGNFSEGPVSVLGYPLLYGRRLMLDTGSVNKSSIDNVYFHHSNLEVNPGNSGGPIFIYGADGPYAVGIVSTRLWSTALSGHFWWLLDAMKENDRLLPQTLVGTSSADKLWGDLGNDSLSGGSGDDTLDGGDDDDRIWGDDGSDNLIGGDGNDHIDGGWSSDALSGNAGNDTLVGGFGDDRCWGDDGADRISGNFGWDRLEGGNGADTLWGDDAGDILVGGWGSDLLEGGTGADSISGGSDPDTIVAGADDDRLWGDDGGDLLSGNDGNDRIEGLAGDDWAWGDQGNDTVVGGAGNDRLEGGEDADLVSGNSGNDTLVGGAGNDKLWGDEGADRLSGGPGSDTLDGGGALGGTDVFEYWTIGDSPTLSPDLIWNFVRGASTIDLNRIDADTSRALDNSFAFIGTSAFSAPAQLRITAAGGGWRVEGNVDANLAADIAILVFTADGSALAARDFFL